MTNGKGSLFSMFSRIGLCVVILNNFFGKLVSGILSQFCHQGEEKLKRSTHILNCLFPGMRSTTEKMRDERIQHEKYTGIVGSLFN